MQRDIVAYFLENISIYPQGFPGLMIDLRQTID